jgi:hypothetical protein
MVVNVARFTEFNAQIDKHLQSNPQRSRMARISNPGTSGSSAGRQEPLRGLD